MPKQALKVGSFHDGLNSKADPRDIKDGELALAKNVSVDDIGLINLSGSKSSLTTSGLSGTTIGDTDGYGLFRFSSDFNKTGGDVRTNYLIAWDDTAGKFYWLPGTTTWETNSTFLDLSTDWGTSDGAIPTYYYADGALRVSDGNLDNDDNPSMWIGNIDRTLFPDNGSSTAVFTGWQREKQELETPTVGQVSSTVPANLTEIPADGVRWRIFNLREQTEQLSDFSDSSNNPGAEDMYFMDEEFGYNNTSSNDESWQTVRNITDGYKDSDAHLYGFAFYEEDDDANNNWSWKTHGDGDFNSGNKTFSTGQSLYLAARMTGEEQKQMWLGTHYRPESGDAFLSLSVDDATIRFLDTGDSEHIKYHIDHTMFTDSTTPSGEWHILEFPFDDSYESTVSGGTITIEKLHLELSVSWTRKNDITNVAARSNIYGGEPFIELSDLRVGESGLVGVDTVGKQKFLMSYTYDDKENESLLYNFGATESNTSPQEVVLPNSTSSYKIGIEAYIDDLNTSTFNRRVTGANLYMEDEGIPYRIAELRYMKGLRGAWESEYPTGNRFAAIHTNGNKTSLIKTDGLPLLESYEAMNGFSPSIPTLAANYKTAVVQNRQTYIGNVHQDGTTHGDRMVKTVTNSFDVFPTEGREIDVVMNDGDDIIKLETYADRILQFKRNTMYLINATRSAEYLEDSFLGKGVTSSSAVTKTDMGVAWANENGCYLYDGEKVHNISDGLIKESDWQTHITSSTDVAYVPLKHKILVSGGANGQDIYEFSMNTKSWTRSSDKLDTTKSNFVIDIDNEVKWVAADNLFKWDDSSSASSAIDILTKDFDFGNPAARKKCFKFYVTYRCANTTNVQVFYGTDGLDLTGGADGTEVKDTSKFAGTSTSCYGDDGLVSTGGGWKTAELRPLTTASVTNIYSVQLHFKSAATTPLDFAINDITIIYRQKPLK